jgi:hypothetical protein
METFGDPRKKKRRESLVSFMIVLYPGYSNGLAKTHHPLGRS